MGNTGMLALTLKNILDNLVTPVRYVREVTRYYIIVNMVDTSRTKRNRWKCSRRRCHQDTGVFNIFYYLPFKGTFKTFIYCRNN